ncbi:serine/threonine protein kinase [Gloeomargarita lithophora Alchichica-D10]|uniref:non-specific serine/threonine protein kinase n=1 Tax=Gloeomargarita lithophora Alchichica-D10 TaxID=1188229 RepID=A0A1J0ABF9_9CYAN|nr:serine/threonine-protein kinase [Gloeomargarita lithophora]APB33263.1 serine/threonine protein kinase [Gloeomargarita lithophora Alchichica-D10]
MLGQLLDNRYQVHQLLGSGGFSRTYLAQDTRRPGQPVCVVKQLVHRASDPEQLAFVRRLFRQEGEILERLGEQDQIPRLLAYFEQKEEFFLVQEYIEGLSLEQELTLPPVWNETQVLNFLKDVLTTLTFVHAQNVIHRDIKPSNLIRRHSDQKIVLLDFGAVKRIHSGDTPADGQSTLGLGTTGYAPLEQVEGRPRPGSDIYALGVMAIQGLIGVNPLQIPEDDQGELLWQVPNLHPTLTAVLRRMTRRYYWDRYDRTAAVLQDLATVEKHLYEPPETLLLPKVGNLSRQGDIVLVDDQPERLRWLSLTLVEQGFNVRSTADGTLALEMAQTQTPDLLLVEAALPGMDGYEFCQRCQSQSALQAVPVMILSDQTAPWAAVKAFSVGAVDYLPRPFKVLELIARMETRLHQGRLCREVTFLQQQLQQTQARLQMEIQCRQDLEQKLHEHPQPN